MPELKSESVLNNPEYRKLERAWTEAIDRLSDIDDSECARLLTFTQVSSAEEVFTYLEKEQENLLPEAKFFLKASAALKQFKQ